MISTELGYLSGVTSNIQDQLNGKALSGHSHDGQSINPTGIELNTNGGLNGYGGYIDFHFNGSQEDYTSRIFEEAEGILNIKAPVGFRVDSCGYNLIRSYNKYIWFSRLCVDNNCGDSLPSSGHPYEIFFLKA